MAKVQQLVAVFTLKWKIRDFFERLLCGIMDFSKGLFEAIVKYSLAV